MTKSQDGEMRLCLVDDLTVLKITSPLTRSPPLLQYLDQLQKGISNSKSVHTRVRKEVRQEVHVRTEVRRFVDKEEVLHRVVDEEDVKERVILAKTNNNHSHNVPVGGLDHQSMEGVIQCMNDDQVDKSVKGVSRCTSVDHVDKDFVMDDPEFKATDNEEGSYYDTFLSTQQVREIMNDFFDTLPIGPDSVQDVGVSESMVVDQPSLDTVKTGVVPLHRQKYPGKACKKRHRVMKLDNPNIVIRTLIGPDGNEIPLLPWKDLAGAILKEVGYLMMHPNDDWAMASPYLCDMLLQYEYPLYYVDGVKYGVPWFAKSVKKVYFPVNESDSHWVLGELDITSGVITFYDSLGVPPVPRLSHNIPLEVDDSSTVAFAWRERLIDFYWRYKILQDEIIAINLDTSSDNSNSDSDNNTSDSVSTSQISTYGEIDYDSPEYKRPPKSLLKWYGYLSDEYKDSDKEKTNKDIKDKDIIDEDCIHDSNYIMSKGKYVPVLQKHNPKVKSPVPVTRCVLGLTNVTTLDEIMNKMGVRKSEICAKKAKGKRKMSYGS
ncbi:phospholipase-like protein [Tanacetum coccineum]